MIDMIKNWYKQAQNKLPSVEDYLEESVISCNVEYVKAILDNKKLGRKLKKSYLVWLLNRSYTASSNQVPAKKSCQSEITKFLLERHPFLVKYDVKKNSILNGLHYACMWGNLDIVKLYAENGISPNSFHNLQVSILGGRYDIVKYLIEKGIDLNGNYGEPLRGAVGLGDNGKMLNLLLDNGANIHIENDSALDYAVQLGKLDEVKILISRGANMHARGDLGGHSPLEYAGKDPAQKETLDYLLSLQEGKQAQNNLPGLTDYLKAAIRSNSLSYVEAIVDSGEDMGDYYKTMFHALQMGKSDIFMCLYGNAVRKLPVDVLQGIRNSALEASCGSYDLSRTFFVTKMLLAQGADPNSNNGTPLNNCCGANIFHNSASVLKLAIALLSSGADPNICPSDSKPIDIAIRSKQKRLIRLFVAHGAEVTNETIQLAFLYLTGKSVIFHFLREHITDNPMEQQGQENELV